MSLPPLASNAQIASDAAKLALQAYSDGLFISQTAQAITNAEDQGIYFVTLTTFENCNIQYLQTYLHNLGYVIDFIDNTNPNLNPRNPAELFGWAYVRYWANGGIGIPPNRNPARMRLRWRIPLPIPSPDEFFQQVPAYSALIWSPNLIFPHHVGG